MRGQGERPEPPHRLSSALAAAYTASVKRARTHHGKSAAAQANKTDKREDGRMGETSQQTRQLQTERHTPSRAIGEPAST